MRGVLAWVLRRSEHLDVGDILLLDVPQRGGDVVGVIQLQGAE